MADDDDLDLNSCSSSSSNLPVTRSITEPLPVLQDEPSRENNTFHQVVNHHIFSHSLSLALE